MNSSNNSTAHDVALDILRSILIKANGPVLTSAVSFEMDWKKRFKKYLLSFEIWVTTLPPEEFIFVKEIGRGTIAYNFSNVAATGGMAGTSQYFTSKNDDVNILAQWATNGVGKKLVEKFGFSEKDIAVGPTSTMSMPKGQGLGYSNRQRHHQLGGTQISGIKEERLELGTALVQDYFCHQQNLAQLKESIEINSDMKGQQGWYEDKSAASPSMVLNSADSSSSVRLENGGGNETSNMEAAGVGSKRKADFLESTNNGSSSIPINKNVIALQELLSIFLCELQQMLASKQVSKEWAAALLLDTARAVILSNDSPSDS